MRKLAIIMVAVLFVNLLTPASNAFAAPDGALSDKVADELMTASEEIFSDEAGKVSEIKKTKIEETEVSGIEETEETVTEELLSSETSSETEALGEEASEEETVADEKETVEETEDESVEEETTLEQTTEEAATETNVEEVVEETIATETNVEETVTETTEETTNEVVAEEKSIELKSDLATETPEEYFTWDGTMITGYTGTDTKVVIPRKATAIDGDAFQVNKEITSVTITENITSIDSFSFRYCTSLEEVIFETTKLGREGCGNGIFSSCKLSTVILPEGMTCIPKQMFAYATFAEGAKVTIPASVTEICDYAFEGANNLEEVIFAGNNVTEIGGWAFYKSKIKKIELPQSLEKIGTSAFRECINLTEITIPSNVSELGDAFDSCYSLNSVTIETKKLGKDGCGPAGIFYGCNISKVVFPEGITYIPDCLFDGAGFVAGMSITIPASVTEIGEDAFRSASNLSEIIFEGDKVVAIGAYAFSRTAIKKFEIPKNVKVINKYTFFLCTNLEEITIPANVTTIGEQAFARCKNLSSVTIETTKLGKNGCENGIFADCSISNVTFPEGITYMPDRLFNSAGFVEGAKITIPGSVKEIGSGAFSYARNLSEIIFEEDNVTKIGERAFFSTGIKKIELPSKIQAISPFMLNSCPNLEEITIPSNVKEIGEWAFFNSTALSKVTIETTKIAKNKCGESIFKRCNIETVILPEGMKCIPDMMFYGAGFAQGAKVTIPASVTEIGKNAFQLAENLSEVVFAGDKVSAIGAQAFAESGITAIEIPKKVTVIKENTFTDCENLKKITIPSKVTKLGKEAFKGCYGLEEVIIETTKIGKKGCGDDLFKNCNISSVSLPSDMKYVPAKLFQNAGFADETSITIPANVTEIGAGAFSGARYIEEINFAGDKVSVIGEDAFSGTLIKEIKIPENLKKISARMFKGCVQLDNVVIPEKVTSIDSEAFFGCSWLDHVILPANVKKIATDAIPKNALMTIYAPKDSITYKWAKNNGYNVVEIYTITYNLNGGINASDNPTYYINGTALTINEPTKAGYAFTGWYEDAKFKKVFNYDAQTPRHLKLYAKWDVTTYTISYETNGGTLAKNSPVTYKVTSAVTLKSPTKTGYAFTGWYTSENLSVESKITKINKGSSGDLKLYAGWLENTYSIKFSANASGVSGNAVTISNIGYDDEVKLEASVYERPGYLFTGWNTKANGKGIVIEDSATVSRLSAKNKSTITLYAMWETIPYSITYVLDGGNNHAKNPAYYTVAKAVTFSNPTKTGYTFKGWYADEKFAKKITGIKKGSMDPVTVYAKWQVNTYTVKFNANKGTGKMAALSCEYDNEYTLTANSFTRKGYVFAGWNTKANGSGISYENEQKISNLTSVNKKNITLYAQWKKN